MPFVKFKTTGTKKIGHNTTFTVNDVDDVVYVTDDFLIRHKPDSYVEVDADTPPADIADDPEPEPLLSTESMEAPAKPKKKAARKKGARKG